MRVPAIDYQQGPMLGGQKPRSARELAKGRGPPTRTPALLSCAPNFRELRACEVQHSPTPIGPGDAGEEMLIPLGIMCQSPNGERSPNGGIGPVESTIPGEGLGHRGGAMRRAGAQ